MNIIKSVVIQEGSQKKEPQERPHEWPWKVHCVPEVNWYSSKLPDGY